MNKDAKVVTPEELWDNKGCARYLNKSVRWIWTRINDGSIPYVRVGRTPRFDPAVIRAWVSAGCPPNSPTALDHGNDNATGVNHD